MNFFKNLIKNEPQFRIRIVELKNGTFLHYPEYKGGLTSYWTTIAEVNGKTMELPSLEVAAYDGVHAEKILRNFNEQLELIRAKEVKSQEIIIPKIEFKYL